MERNDIDERKDDILQWIKENKSKAWMARELNCNQKTIASKLLKWGIEYKGNQSHKGEKINKTYVPAQEYLGTDKMISSYKLKLKLLQEGIKDYECERCKRRFWLDEPIPLELHHKDGNHFNNSLENLEILCPNCHALTDNYRSKNRK